MNATQHSPTVVVYAPSGELDASTIGPVRQAFGTLSAERCVVVDLTAVSFIDSSALGALVGLARRLQDRGGRMAFVCKRQSLLRLLKMVGFDRIVPVAVSLEAALAAVEAPRAGPEALSPDPG